MLCWDKLGCSAGGERGACWGRAGRSAGVSWLQGLGSPCTASWLSHQLLSQLLSLSSVEKRISFRLGGWGFLSSQRYSGDSTLEGL